MMNENAPMTRPPPAISPPAASDSLGLLYPAEVERRPVAAAGRPEEADLGLATIVRALDVDGRHSRFVGGVLAELTTDTRIIAHRQEVLDDLLRMPDLATAIGAALPARGELSGAGRAPRWGERVPLLEVAGRLAELDAYVECVELLWAALDTDDGRRTEDERQRTEDEQTPARELAPALGPVPHSSGLKALRERLAAVRAEPDFAALVAELPALRAQLERAGSVTLGINLDAQLRPESATLVSINPARFSGKGSMLDRLFGERAVAEAVRGITALYNADDGRQHTPEHVLFRELSRLLERVVQPVAAAIERYTRLSSRWLVALEPELAFYLGAARLFGELRAAGLPLCRPAIAPPAERTTVLDGVYNLDLALRLRAATGRLDPPDLVLNDVRLGPTGRIAIVTGPNSGGKTTYTRAVGQAQALFQAGLLLPAHSARISPVDGIFSHFASSERNELGRGRLAQELERLAAIFRQASPNSLLVFNEALASTDQLSARALGRDLLAGMRLLGARAIFVTHLHELVADALALDAGAAEPSVVSLVADVAVHEGNGVEQAPTYRIVPGMPQAPRYAAELARQYGLETEQIARMLRERGML
jgi:hypothetical protein